MPDHDDDDDDEHPDTARLFEVLKAIDLPGRYYALCAAHAARGSAPALADQQAAMTATGRPWTYDKREKFFAWRDPAAPRGCELGLNVKITSGVELNLVFGTPAGHLGGPLAGLALRVKQLTDPRYRHTPPYPTPGIGSAAELREILTGALALCDAAVAAIRAGTWSA